MQKIRWIIKTREVHENEQHPIDFKIPDEAFQPTMVEIKKQITILVKRAEKRKQLERQLSQNTFIYLINFTL